jgi:hypothetical protein
MEQLTADRLRELLEYDPETGVFRWKEARAPNAKAGDEAGFIHRDGYRYIRIGQRQYAAHRLAWLYVTGEWPASHLDHRDMERTNNSLGNLRPASHSQNQANRPKQANNTSGFKGVYWQARSGK